MPTEKYCECDSSDPAVWDGCQWICGDCGKPLDYNNDFWGNDDPEELFLGLELSSFNTEMK